MDPEIRPARAEEMEDFMNVVRAAYALPQSFTVNIRPEWTLCAFSCGKLVTSYGAWPLTMHFAGSSIPIAGVTWVATHPLHRRKNYLRKVIKTHFERLYEQGEQPIAALQASMAAIYQRYGYGVASSYNTYSIEPRFLGCSLNHDSQGNLRAAQDGDMGVMVELYNRFAASRIGYIIRKEKMELVAGNSFTVLAVMPPASPSIKLIYEENSQPLGYVIYSVVRDTSQGNPLGQRIMIHDMAWLSPSAYQSIWGYFSNLDLVTRVDWNKVPLDDPLPHLLLEPRKLNLTSADGLLARIVDVKSALLRRPYSGEGSLTFEVIDSLCSWNQGRWKLEAARDGNTVKTTDEESQLKVPISTLAMLFFGQITATQAAEMGRLEVNDRDALPLMDKIFKTPYRPFCADSI